MTSVTLLFDITIIITVGFGLFRTLRIVQKKTSSPDFRAALAFIMANAFNIRSTPPRQTTEISPPATTNGSPADEPPKN